MINFLFSINSTEYFTFNQSEDIVSYKRYVVEFDIYKPREIKKNNKWDNLSLNFLPQVVLEKIPLNLMEFHIISINVNLELHPLYIHII